MLGYLAQDAFRGRYTGLIDRDEIPTLGRCGSNISIHIKVCFLRSYISDQLIPA
jgi:hypothetical protein